jgi:hypothetical protein
MSRYKYMEYTRKGLFSLPFMLAPMSAGATDFTAGIVMEKMNEKERYTYLAGVVEGLAYARYAKDGKKTDGMKCIYDWFYDSKGTVAKIESAFQRFNDYLPGAVLAAMVEKECGS